MFQPVELPDWASHYLEPGPRHIAAWGGRGGAKSRTAATALLIRAQRRVERVLCAREIQRSIRQSVKRLLDDTIQRHGWGQGPGQSGFFYSTDTEIRGANGSLFSFAGLKANTEQIKSLEGYTVAWIEEARGVSQASIDVLTPTLRASGSQLLWTWNPKFAKDPVDQMFRGAKGPPPRSVLIEVHAEHNRWFPEELAEEMAWLRVRDPDKYQHVWRGAYLRNSESRVFTNWTEEEFDTPADAVFRMGADWGFAIDPTVLVRCFIGRWDGGVAVADHTGRTLFIDHEAWSIKCPPDDTPALFAGDDVWRIPPRWTNPQGRPGIPGATRWRITADSARPEMVAYMAARGFDIESAIKGPGSLEDGVEFLKAYDIVVHPRCAHVIDELTLYSYKTDPLTEEVLPVLADKKNNTIDATRYALEGVRRAGSGKITFASSGPRLSVSRGDPGRATIDTLTKPAATTSSGGRGWGSNPSSRKGI
jgi:phage terminase large subunit